MVPRTLAPIVATVVTCAAVLAQPRSFVLAAYTDGGLVPFARFTGAEWVNTWPAPRESDVPVPPLADIPNAWLGKPIPRQWTFWPASGNRRSMTVVGTRRGDGTGGGCTQPAVLTIDRSLGSEARGLAVDSDQAIEAVRRVPPQDAEWRRLQPIIIAAVRANERQLVAAPFNRPWQQEVLAEVDLFQAPLAIESLYRPVANGAPVLYYFEASRSATRRNGSPLKLKVGGWAAPDASGRVSAFALTGSVFEDEGMWTMTPLAIVRLSDRSFWIAAMSYYESSRFVIRDVSPGAVRDVLTSDHGGC